MRLAKSMRCSLGISPWPPGEFEPHISWCSSGRVAKERTTPTDQGGRQGLEEAGGDGRVWGVFQEQGREQGQKGREGRDLFGHAGQVGANSGTAVQGQDQRTVGGQGQEGAKLVIEF